MLTLLRTSLIAIVVALGAKVRVGAGGEGQSRGVQRGAMPERQPSEFPPPGSVHDDVGPTSRPAGAAVDSGATSELRQAQTALDDLQKKMRADYEATPEFTAAAAAVKSAQAEYDAAAKAAADAIKTTPDYVAASASLKQAEDAVQAARDDKSGDSATKLPQLAMDAMNARATVRKLESNAATTDPACLAARAKVADATQKLGALRSAAEAKIRQDPDYIAAQKAVADARGKLASSSPENRRSATR